jgi:hypothetical protein
MLHQGGLEQFGIQKLNPYERVRWAFNKEYPDATRVAQDRKSPTKPRTWPKAAANIPTWMAAYCTDSITYRSTTSCVEKMVIPEYAHDLDSMRRSNNFVAPPLPPSFEPSPQYQEPNEKNGSGCTLINQIANRRDSGVDFIAAASPQFRALSPSPPNHSQSNRDDQLPQPVDAVGKEQHETAPSSTQQDFPPKFNVLTRIMRLKSQNHKVSKPKAVMEAEKVAVIEGLNRQARKFRRAQASRVVKRARRLLRRQPRKTASLKNEKPGSFPGILSRMS